MSSTSKPQVIPAIRDRQSARRFLSTSVPPEAVRRILEAARLAPSGANRQPWQFVVIDDPQVKREVRACCEEAETRYHANAPADLRAWFTAHGITPSKPFLEDAPVLIATFFDPRAPYAIPSVWITIAHILLQASAEGLYSLSYTPTTTKLSALLGVPEPYRLAAILPIGHADPPPRQPRHPLAAVVAHNRYGIPFPKE